MGTNFYLRKRCDHCANVQEEHIGKQSSGWKFCFYSAHRKTKNEWLDYLSKNKDLIYNEYGDQETIESFKEMIEAAKNGFCHQTYGQKFGKGRFEPTYKETIDDGVRLYPGEFS